MAQTVDTSMYATDPNAGMNKLQALMQMQGTQVHNNLMQQEYQSQQGLAGLYSNAPKDSDGNPDSNYIIANAGQAGTKAADAIQGALAIQNQKAQVQRQLVGLSSDQLELGKKVNDAIVSTTVPIMSDLQSDIDGGTYDPKQWRSKVNGAYADLVNASADNTGKPTITPQRAISNIQTLDFDNPKALLADLKSRAAQAQAWDGHLAEALNTKRGILGSAPVGLGTQPTTQDMVSGNVQPAGPVVPTGTSFVGGKTTYNSKVVSPNNPFSAVNPSNPNNQPSQQSGQGPSTPMAALASKLSPTQGGPTPQAATSMQDSALPEAPPGYAAQLGPAQKEVNDAIEYGNNVIRLEPSLKGVLQFADAGGPNSEVYNRLKGALGDTQLAALFNADTTGPAKYEILSKFASDVAGQNMGANARNELESQVQALSNPNSAQFPLALKTVSNFLLGRMNAAKAQADYLTPLASDPGVTPADIRSAQRDWRANYDQTLFEMPYLSKDEKINKIGQMSDPEYKAFQRKAKFMEAHGLVDKNDAQ